MAEISVIVPAFKTGEYIQRCIDSIVSQNINEIEPIIIVDGSEDNCDSLSDESALNDSRIIVIHQLNHGVSIARNNGITIATGERLLFCDSDDYYFKNAFNTLMSAIAETDCDYLEFKWKTINENLPEICNFSGIQKSFPLTDAVSKKKYIVDKASLKTGMWSVCVAVFRRNIITKNAILFCSTCHNFAEDLGFTLSYLCFAESAILTDFVAYCYDTTRESSTMHGSVGQMRLDDVNEVSAYAKQYYCRVFPEQSYADVHHAIIWDQYREAYGAKSLAQLRQVYEELLKIRQKDHFVHYNESYMASLNNKGSSFGQRWIEKSFDDLAIDYCFTKAKIRLELLWMIQKLKQFFSPVEEHRIG